MHNQCLIELLNASQPLTVGEIAARLKADSGSVRRAINALMGEGLIFADGDRAVNGYIIPAWDLTSAGEHAAHAARVAARNAVAMGTEKPRHDSECEVRQ